MKAKDWLWTETVTLLSPVASRWGDTSHEGDEQAGQDQQYSWDGGQSGRVSPVGGAQGSPGVSEHRFWGGYQGSNPRVRITYCL